MGKADVKKILAERERRKRSDLAWKLVNDWRRGEIEQLTPYALKAVQIATKRDQDYMTRSVIDPREIQNYAEECAYYIVTQQPNPYRETCLPSHEKQIIAWRISQFIIFAFLFYGIIPLDGEEDMLLSRGCIFALFLAFVAITAWCNHCKQWYSQYQRETATLNALVTTDMIVSILRSKTFADRMRKELALPNAPFKKELKDYLSWLYPEESPHANPQEKAQLE